jgi:3-dehydroquinate synthase
VTTPTVFEIYAQRFIDAGQGAFSRDAFLVLDCTERSKGMEMVSVVCDRSIRALDRSGLIIGFGGGVVMDIATFAASMIRRGIAHAKVPTTLIGQVDAGIGIKGGVNFACKKSYLGCFRAPEEVLIDPGFLASLPRHHLAAGLAEIIKMGLIADRGLFDTILQSAGTLSASGFRKPADVACSVLVQSIRLMMAELRPNITETSSLERKVDFGHTFSPLLESALDFSIPHGFAVAIDIALSAAIAVERGILTEDQFSTIAQCLRGAGLPLWHESLTPDLCLRAMREMALHRGGQMNLIIPNGIGDTAVIPHASDLDDTALSAALARLRACDDRLVG